MQYISNHTAYRHYYIPINRFGPISIAVVNVSARLDQLSFLLRLGQVGQNQLGSGSLPKFSQCLVIASDCVTSWWFQPI